MSSNLRNLLKNKVHKERAQPRKRQKLGILEKHKDYVLRAQDYNEKKKRLKRLKEKAAFKNPDEFYFKMISMNEKKGEQVSAEQLKIFKTQDIGYINMKKTAEAKKVQKLTESMNCITDKPQNTHTIFVESKEEKEAFSPEKYFNTISEAVDRPFNRPTLEQLEKEDLIVNKHRPSMKKIERARFNNYNELLQRMNREKKLDIMKQKMTVQKNIMGKGRKRKIKDEDEESPAIYQWKRVRKP